MTGSGTLDVRRGIAWFLSEANAFGGLALSTYGSYSGRVKLRTAESVLRVRSFTIDGAAQPNGTYTPQTNPGRILQGTIVVDPAAPVAVVSASAGEQIARLDRTAGDMTGSFAVSDGRLDVSVTGGGAGVLRLDDNAVARLLGSAFAHLDASREESCVFEATSDASGNPHVGTWKNLNGNWGHGEKWTGEYFALPNDYGTNWIRGVKAPPTRQSYRFNGVTMKYVDFGTCEKVNMNHCAKSETASAMKFNLNPVQEVHVVHADAHLTDVGTRNVLLGITWYSPDNYNYAAGRRGGNATFFDTANNTTVAYRDGRLYVDNALRDNTFVPAEDDVHVYTIMPNTAFADPPTSFSGHNPGTLCCDGWTCYGGARIGEVVVYETKNTEADRAQIDAYLLMKWTGQGNGPQIPFGKITLADGVSLSLAGYTRDFVRGQVSVRGLAGNGTVSPGATALSCADLSTAFASATVCGRVHVAGTFAFPTTGTLTVSSSVKPKAGEYVVFSAEALSGGENLANWNVRLEGACAVRQDARVFVRGNDVVLAVPQVGSAVLVR